MLHTTVYRRFACSVFAAIFAWLAASAAAFADAPDLAALSSDPDFSLQGEYAGSCYMPGIGHEYVGLQVVAQGDNRFLAVRYRGGLPGAGWDGLLKENLTGERAGEVLTLSGAAQKIEIQKGIATLRDPQGNPLGTLKKLERVSPLMGRPAPAGATVLYGSQPHSPTDAFASAKHSPEGWLAAGALMKMPVQDFQLHLEFRTPFMPNARGQGRGNSGVYIQQRYEVQILDSFGLEGIENECGSLYRQRRPELNMCLPPMSWQTYDIVFTAPRFHVDNTTKAQNALITVWHNGVAIHCQREVYAKTGGGKPESPMPLPINFQDHNDKVVFRNIWILPLTGENCAAEGEASCRTPFLRRGLLRPVCP